jgi:peptidoglycan/xylan/chitin deacetylase (PgdA/CDA1 family)
MEKSLSIITYHFIKKKTKKNSGLKFLEIKKFINQIDYIKKKYSVLDPEEAKYLLKNNIPFSKKCCWLTFDDGYREHYDVAFQELEKRKIRGSFFPVVTSLVDKKILEVNKIQFLLSELNKDFLLKEIEKYYVFKKKNKITFNDFVKKINLKTRFDDKKTFLIKRLLQKYLPETYRSRLVETFFTKYLKNKKKEDYKNIYLKISHLKEMHNNNHEIGIHSYDHPHLNSLSEAQQKVQINSSIKFLKKNALMQKDLTINYPYGSYNSTTKKICKKNKYIKFGLTTKKGILNSYKNDLLILPRIDTNDLRNV